MGIRHSAQMGITLAACMAWWSISATAQDPNNKEAIRLLANDAEADFVAGRYTAALDKFQRAYETAKVPALAVCLAKTHAKLGHLVIAYEMYHEATNLQKNSSWVETIQQKAQQDAREQLTVLQARIAHLTIRVNGADPKDVAVQIDSVPVPANLIGVERLVDPGQRQIVVRLGELELMNEQVTLDAGEHKDVRIKLAQPAPTKPSPADSAPKPGFTAVGADANAASIHDTGATRSSVQQNWGWLSVGVGATGLVLGATTGIYVLAKHSQLSSSCPSGHCPPDKWAESGGLDTWRHVSTVGFIAGAIGTAAGVTLLLTNPKQASKPSVGLWLAPATAGVRGAF